MDNRMKIICEQSELIEKLIDLNKRLIELLSQHTEVSDEENELNRLEESWRGANESPFLTFKKKGV